MFSPIHRARLRRALPRPATIRSSAAACNRSPGATAAGVIPSGLPARMMVGLVRGHRRKLDANERRGVGRALPLLHQGLGEQLGLRRLRRIVGARLHARMRSAGLRPRDSVLPDLRRARRWRVGDAAEARERDHDAVVLRRLQDPDAAREGLRKAGAGAARSRRVRPSCSSRSASNPNAFAAIASSGMPELAGLPNTVAGWGLAFLQIKKAVGANNAILGIHLSAWASGKDIAHFNVTDPLQPEVDKVYNFLAPAGLGEQRDRDSVRRAGRRSARPRCRLLPAGAGAGSLVERQRLGVDLVEELQPLRRVAAALEPESRRSAGCSGRSRSATRTTRTSSTTAAAPRATRTTVPSTSSAAAPRTSQIRRRRRDRAPVRRRHRRHELVRQRHLHRRAAVHEEPRGSDSQRGRRAARGRARRRHVQPGLRNGNGPSRRVLLRHDLDHVAARSHRRRR